MDTEATDKPSEEKELDNQTTLLGRWWKGQGLGWQRINYLLLTLYIFCLIAGIVWLKEQYDERVRSYWWCVDHNGKDNCHVDDIYWKWKEYDLSDFLYSALLPIVTYFILIVIYQWLKEGFQKK